MSEIFRMYDQYSSEINFSSLKNPEDTWELVDLIGQGTYGEVYSARHKVTGELVAVKILESIHEIIEEIEAEYKVLRDLGGHPNMPKFHGLYLKMGEMGSDDQLWMVMELCTGGSVTDVAKSLINEGKKIDEILLAHILKETLQVLGFLHKNHVIHRDVKGHNILLTSDGSVKMIDFGVSGHLRSTLDKRKTSVGTPFWMAPEVIACERQLEYTYDIRCDIWSLGITAIEIMDGEPPLSHKHPMRAMFKIPRNPPPKQRNPNDWSATCQDFIGRCLVKDFSKRPLTWELLNHPFIKQVPHDISQLKSKLVVLSAKIEREVHEPDVTTKQGRLKSRRSRAGPVPTTDDLTKLEVLDEETIVSQLFMRYTQANIYTYIGDILLAVNPFTRMTIYGEEHSLRYMNAAKDDNPPHIFAIADQSYQMMIHQKKHQCIVISGESGAGKTESANFLVQQLTQLGKAPNRNLEEKILQVNPLMEAFGNAKTVINDNSSRFGKYLEMCFTHAGTVTGAKITEYLLEKSRVIYQATGEQNFHIFYYVHDGLPSEDKAHKYHLHDKASYKYISEYKSDDITTISVNRIKFRAIQHCFDIIGFKPEEVTSILGVIAAILHMGNLEFCHKVSQDYTGDGVKLQNNELADIVSKLLGLEAKDLVDVLVTTGMVARGEVIIRENTMAESVDVRDAMSKSLYGRLFSWIVNKINLLLQPDKDASKDDSLRVIGLLDIFGFENFPSNSFEQLCINIANEQIQYYFNQHIFAWELQEYRNEGVDGSVISFVDNRPLLDMFLMKPLGLLALLDEESHFPRATDRSLVEKFHQNVKNPSYSRPKATSSLYFSIDHFAGTVKYNATGFLEKNRDRLPMEVVNLLRSSNNVVVRNLFITPLSKTGNLSSGLVRAGPSSSGLTSPASSSTGFTSVQSLKSQASSMGGSRGSSSVTSMTRVQQTVATYFRFSLMDLLSKMVAGTPHFIRCIRPNEDNLPDLFDTRKVTVQLTYTGVLETTRIRREGYSHRILFADFVNRYSMLTLGESGLFTPDKNGARLLLNKFELKDWALGHTKVFLKFYHIEMLSRRYEELVRKIVTLQAVFRMLITRSRFYRQKWALQEAALVMQKYARGWQVRKKYGVMFIQRRSAVLMIQKVFRGFRARQQVAPVLRRRREAAVIIQSGYRGQRARTRVQELRAQKADRPSHLQAVFRDHHARNMSEKEAAKMDTVVVAATMIQSWYRMIHSRRVYQQLLKYHDSKELQLIFFSQQVEAYSNDLRETMSKTNFIAKPVPIPAVSMTTHSAPTPGPSHTQQDHQLATPTSTMIDSVQRAGNRKRRAPQQPQGVAKQPAVAMPIPDVSEERLLHQKKMKELKCLLPDREMDYYKQLNENMVNGENVSTTSSSRLKQSRKEVMDAESETYYSTVVKRSGAHEDSEDDLIPLGESAATMTMNRQIAEWDRPLVEAQKRALKLTSVDEEEEKTPPLSPFMLISPSKYTPTMQGTPSNAQSLDTIDDLCLETPDKTYPDIPLPNQLEPVTKVQKWRTCINIQKGIPSNHQFSPAVQSVQSTTDITGQSVPIITPLGQSQPRFDQLSNQSKHSITSIDQSELKLDQLELSSESSFPSTAHMSISSHEIAIRMLDRAIEGSLSEREPLASPPREPSPDSRDHLARRVAETILANKPGRDDNLLSWLPRTEPSLDTLWSSPSEENCYHGITLTQDCDKPTTQPQDIDEDLKTDKEEFFKESNKDELLEKLKDEYTNSPKGKWQLLQNLVLSGIFVRQHKTQTADVTSQSTSRIEDSVPQFQNHRQRQALPVQGAKTVISVSYSGVNQNGFHGDRQHDLGNRSKVKFSTRKPTIIGTNGTGQMNGHSDGNNNVSPLKQTFNGSHSVLFNQIGVKPTKIIPEITKSTTEDDKPLYDFRKHLRKTGRLDFIKSEQ